MFDMRGDTVSYDTERNKLIIIDQTKLPSVYFQKELDEPREIADAIYKLEVRGAPAIGVAAAIGVAVTAEKIQEEESDEFFRKLKENAEIIRSARPTAVNLSWAVDEMLTAADEGRNNSTKEIKKILTEKAKEIHKNDIDCCRKIGENGASLLEKSKAVLTHCNAGRLATVKYGTALAPIYVLNERGVKIKVYADETRPLLQGARLTAFELSQAGIETEVICDNMASTVMAQKKVDAVIVGADRIAENGDTANKIGTCALAVLARFYNIPFYVAAPFSTIDKNTVNGDGIHIEQRDESEVSTLFFKSRMIPDGVKAFNPAFDITPNELITAFITEKGVISAEDF